ncbi:MAG: hypothetical protein AAF211_32415 [Myxococcota bacterium]
MILLSIASAAAGPSLDGTTARPLLGHAFVELRGGVQGGGATGVGGTLCGQISPLRYVAIEACGSGGGFLFPDASSELVHFRAEAHIPLMSQGALDLALEPGVGFAELEAGADAPGFRFGPARSPDQREGAGPAASLALKGRWWARPRWFVTMETGVSVASIPSAPVVAGTSGPVITSGMTTVGLGF